jgi:NCAIR mutase (PurE)-related protein
MTREELELVINDTSVSQEVRDDAQAQLDKITALETRQQSEGVDEDVLFAVKEFNKSIEKLAKAGVDKNKMAIFKSLIQNVLYSLKERIESNYQASHQDQATYLNQLSR